MRFIQSYKPTGWAKPFNAPRGGRHSQSTVSYGFVAEGRNDGLFAVGEHSHREVGPVGDEPVESEQVEAKVPRSHWDMLLERRTRAELEELLQERLEFLRARRGQQKIGA